MEFYLNSIQKRWKIINKLMFNYIYFVLKIVMNIYNIIRKQQMRIFDFVNLNSIFFTLIFLILFFKLLKYFWIIDHFLGYTTLFQNKFKVNTLILLNQSNPIKSFKIIIKPYVKQQVKLQVQCFTQNKKLNQISIFEHINYQMLKKLLQLFAQLTFNFHKYSLLQYICFRIILILLFAFNIYFSLNYSKVYNYQNILPHQNIKNINIDTFTLQLPHIILAILLILLLLISYEVVKYIISNNQFIFFARLVQLLPLFCPILLTFVQITFIYNDITSTPILYLLLMNSIIICILWITRILIIKQNYVYENVKIENDQQILQAIMFTGNIILNIGVSDERIVKVWSVLISLILMVHKFYNVSYLQEELEYIDFLGKILNLQLVLISCLLEYFANDTKLIIISGVVLLVILQRMNFLKLMFQEKYIKLLDIREKLNRSQDIIILSHIAQNKNKQKNFDFYFYRLLDSALLQYLIFSERNIFLDIQKCQKNPIKNLLQCKYTECKPCLRFKNYLIYWYLKNHEYLKAIKISAQLNYQNQQFLYIYYSHLCNLEMNSMVKKCQKCFKIVQSNSSENICFIQKREQQLNSNQILEHENSIVNLIDKIKKLNYLNNNFLKKLNMENLQSNYIQQSLVEQYKLKQQIINYIQTKNSKFKTKQFVLLCYIFLSVYCSKKYSIFSYFLSMLQKIQKNYYCIKKKYNIEKYLVVLVSGENDSIGMITNANIQMKLFFNLKQDHIQQKNITINRFLPLSIAQKHNQFIYNFKQKGLSTFIGKNKQMYMVNHSYCLLVQIYVKIYPFIEGLSFSARIRIINRQQHLILYNICGFIESISEQVEEYLNIKEKKNIIDILQQPQLIKSARRNRTEIDLKTERYQMINLNNKILKAKMKFLSGENYYLGICQLIAYPNSFHLRQHKSKQPILDVNKSCSVKTIEIDATQKNTEKFMEIQNKLQNINKDDEKIKNYKLGIMGIILLVIFGFSYTQTLLNQYTTYMIQSIQFYDTLSSDFVARNFQTYNIFLLINAIQSGYINDNITTKYKITSFQSHLRASAQTYLATTANTEAIIDQFIQAFTMQQSNLITIPDLDFSVSKANVKLSILQAISLQKSFLVEIFNLSPQSFTKDFSLNFRIYQYLTNHLCLLAKQMFEQILNLITEELNLQNNQILIVISCVFGTIIMMAILNIIFRHKITKKKRKYMFLLNQINNDQLTNKFIINLNSQRLINTMTKYSIDYIEIYQNIQNFCCVINKSEHLFRKSKIDFQFNPSVNNTLPKFKNSIKKIKISDFKIDISDIISIIFMITPLAFYIIQSIFTTMQIKKEIDVYSLYKNQIETLKTNLPLLFNIPIYNILFKNLTQSFFNIPSNQLISTIQGQIIHRNFQNMLQNYLDWGSASTFLYNSHCDTQDQLCQTLLSGSLNQSVSSIIIQFTTKVILVSNKMKTNNYPYGIDILNEICEIQICYQKYISPLLKKASDYGIDISTNIISDNLKINNRIFMFGILPFTIVSIMWMIYDLKNKEETLEIIKKQMLSFDSVDILSQKIQFSYEFNKI